MYIYTHTKYTDEIISIYGSTRSLVKGFSGVLPEYLLPGCMVGFLLPDFYVLHSRICNLFVVYVSV
jgi:hypothetical protein